MKNKKISKPIIKEKGLIITSNGKLPKMSKNKKIKNQKGAFGR